MLQRLQRVHDSRLSQIANPKDYRSEYGKLLRAYNRLVAAGPARNIPTPQEQALLDKQQHVGFSEMSEGEQQRLQGEVDSLFGQIPAHLQKKAREMAGVS